MDKHFRRLGLVWVVVASAASGCDSQNSFGAGDPLPPEPVPNPPNTPGSGTSTVPPEEEQDLLMAPA